MTLPAHATISLLQRVGVRQAAMCALVYAFSAVTVLTTDASAQSLMVGADGTVHLDQFEEVQANDPVIIEQSPELVGPSIVGPGQMVGAPWQAPMSTALDPCSVPFVPGTPVVQMGQSQQPMPIKYSVFGEFLFLHPTGVDMVHAQPQDGGAVPLGKLGVTDFHYEPGVRVGGDMAMSSTTSIAGTFTYFESNAVSRVNAPIIPGGGGTVGSLVHHPGTGLTASAGPVDARSVLDFQLGDAEYRTRLWQGPQHWVNGGVGLRYGKLEQEFGQTGIFGGGALGTIVTQSDIDFEGGGVKLGIDGGRSIGKRGLSIYGRAGVSPLAGQFHSDYVLHNDTADQTLAQVSWDDDRIVTLLEYEFGIAWTGPRRRWRVAAGYTTTHWFNAVTTGDFINSVQSHDYTDVSRTISFDGLAARVEHLW